MVGSITTHAKDDGEKTPDSLVLVVGKKTASSSQRKNTRTPDVVVDNQSRKRTPDSVVKKKLSRSVSQKKTPDSVIEKKSSRSVSQNNTMSELRCPRRKSRKLETTFATSSYPTKPNAISYTLDGIYPFWDAPWSYRNTANEGTPHQHLLQTTLLKILLIHYRHQPFNN